MKNNLIKYRKIGSFFTIVAKKIFGDIVENVFVECTIEETSIKRVKRFLNNITCSPITNSDYTSLTFNGYTVVILFTNGKIFKLTGNEYFGFQESENMNYDYTFEEIMLYNDTISCESGDNVNVLFPNGKIVHFWASEYGSIEINDFKSQDDVVYIINN